MADDLINANSQLKKTHTNVINEIIELTNINLLKDILMSFQFHHYAFMRDIMAFFHQLCLHLHDVNAFRYLWFADKTIKTAVIELFLAHILGLAASSEVSSFTLQNHAESVKDEYPSNVYNMIRNLFYVDDGSGGDDMIESLPI